MTKQWPNCAEVSAHCNVSTGYGSVLDTMALIIPVSARRIIHFVIFKDILIQQKE